MGIRNLQQESLAMFQKQSHNPSWRFGTEFDCGIIPHEPLLITPHGDSELVLLLV